MPANTPNASSAYTRLESINQELYEINTTILRELPRLNKDSELVGELIRRCELLLCNLLEIRSAKERPGGFEGLQGDPGSDGSGSTLPPGGLI